MRSTASKKTTPALLLALVLATLLATLLSSSAKAQQYADSTQYAQQGPLTATGVLARAAPHSPDPSPVYAITDEATGAAYELTSGFVELEPFVGQRVTVTGAPVPGSGDPNRPPLLNVTTIAPADDPGGGEEEELATLTFELAVEGTPPAGTAFYGNVPVEGSFDTRVPLADPDGDGLYTGSTTINRFGPGPRPVPAGTEPVSLRIQILQGDSVVIKDFGLVKIDGDKTFEASVSFGDGPGGTDPGNPGGNNPGGTDPGGTDPGNPGGNGGNGGSNGGGSGGGSGSESSAASGSGGGQPSGGIVDKIRSLPETGGLPLLIAVAGALLLGAGLIVRKVLLK